MLLLLLIILCRSFSDIAAIDNVSLFCCSDFRFCLITESRIWLPISWAILYISSSWSCMAVRTLSNSAEDTSVVTFLYAGTMTSSSYFKSPTICCFLFSIISPRRVMSCFLWVVVTHITQVGILQSLQNISQCVFLCKLHSGRTYPLFLLMNSTISCLLVLSFMCSRMHEEQRSTWQRLQWFSTGFGHIWQTTMPCAWFLAITILCIEIL